MLILDGFCLNEFYRSCLKSWAFGSPQQLLVARSCQKPKQTGAMACLVQLFSDQLFWESGCEENLAVGRIWVLLGLRAEEDKEVHRAQYLESDGFLLLQQLKRLYVYVDFE
jgi:hypothetical protein